MSVQAQLPAALAVLHNFIRQYDPGEIRMFEDDQPLDFQIGAHLASDDELGSGLVTPNERAQANQRRDKIADEMWKVYLESRAATTGARRGEGGL